MKLGLSMLAAVYGTLLIQPVAFGQSEQTMSTGVASDSRNNNTIVISDCRMSIVNEVSLACERNGILQFVARQGAMVRKGDVIAKIRDTISKASYKIAEHESSNDIEIQFAKKAGELAQLKYERAQAADRTTPGTVTEFELRELRLAAERSLLQLQQAEHDFTIAQLKKQEQLEQLNSYQIIAPFDAIVRVTPKKPGEFVQQGSVILEIVNDEIMQADGFIDMDDIASVSIGAPVTIYSIRKDGKTVEQHGTVSFVDTKIEPISMKARISAQFQNTNSILKDGLLVKMTIATNDRGRLSLR